MHVRVNKPSQGRPADRRIEGTLGRLEVGVSPSKSLSRFCFSFAPLCRSEELENGPACDTNDEQMDQSSAISQAWLRGHGTFQATSFVDCSLWIPRIHVAADEGLSK